jgi:hypothetical protein
MKLMFKFLSFLQEMIGFKCIFYIYSYKIKNFYINTCIFSRYFILDLSLYMKLYLKQRAKRTNSLLALLLFPRQPTVRFLITNHEQLSSLRNLFMKPFIDIQMFAI